VFYGGSGLLIVIGILLFFLVSPLLGVICILLALFSGGMGYRRGRA
jgi:hypothetical protein